MNVQKKADYIFENVMEDINSILNDEKDFISVYEKSFNKGDSTECTIQDVEEMIDILKQKFKEKELIADITRHNFQIFVTVYLFEKTEEQYQEIDNIMKKGIKEPNFVPKILIAIVVISFVLIFLFPDVEIVKIGVLSVIGLFCVVQFLFLGFTSIKLEKNTKLAEKYCSEQERIPCTENSNLNRLLELHLKYEEST